MKRLSARGAQRCEEAKELRCRCRCGGQLHGRKRGNVCELNIDDPHYPGRPCARCGGNGKCARCNGTGQIRWAGDVGLRPCLQCDATGRCYKCDGRGGTLEPGAWTAAEAERTKEAPAP